MTEVKTIQPGYLVVYNSSVNGGVQYRKETLEYPHENDDGDEESSWTTTKLVADADEHKRAKQTQDKAAWLIKKWCTPGDFAMMCRTDQIDDLKLAITEAHEVVDAFNMTAVNSHVSVSVVVGHVLQDDVEAARGMGREIQLLLGAIQQGLRDLDVDKVRAICSKTLKFGQMLSDNGREQMVEAVTIAREACKDIVKAGNVIAMEIDEVTIETIDQARTAFLDMEADGEFTAEPVFNGIAVDFEAAS